MARFPWIEFLVKHLAKRSHIVECPQSLAFQQLCLKLPKKLILFRLGLPDGFEGVRGPRAFSAAGLQRGLPRSRLDSIEKMEKVFLRLAAKQQESLTQLLGRKLLHEKPDTKCRLPNSWIHASPTVEKNSVPTSLNSFFT